MHIRGQFSDFFLDTMLPAINHVIWSRYNRFPEQWSKIFRDEASTRSIEQTSQVSGLGLFGSLVEGQGVRYDQAVQGFKQTFTHTRYGLGMKVSQDVVEDDNIGLVTKTSRELGRSARETLEIDIHSTINNGFDGAYTGPDGVCLFSASHPLVKAGGTQSNVLSAADLDVTSLELALTAYETQVDSSGKKINLPTPRLFGAPANRWNMAEILESKMRSDTANNTTNAFKFGENGPVESWNVDQYFTDPDSWFLFAQPEDTELLVYFRRKPYTKADFDFDTETGKTAMRYKKSHGWGDYIGTFGVPGA